MATLTCRIEIKYALWLQVYIGTIKTISRLTNMEPNMDRVGYWIGKGITVKVVR